MQTVELEKDVLMPILGFGTYQLSGAICQKAVTDALEIGYRHIDTADRYGNHHDVANAIAESGIARKDIFLTTKIWRGQLRKEDVGRNLARFQDELQTDYFDLVLIHWPNRDIPIDETLSALQKAKESRLIRAVGVSNFTEHHLADALGTGFKPSVNQVEFHPTFYQKALLQYCQSQAIVVTAYSPVGQGKDLHNNTIQEIAQKHSASASQVILAWIRQKGVVAIPRSASKNHIADNFKSLDLNLAEEDIARIDNLYINERLINPLISDFDY